MKPNQVLTSLLAVTALFVASCSAPKLAQNSSVQDDVYNTTAQAKEYKPTVAIQNTQMGETTDSDADYYGKSDPNYDMDYSSRIDRFYYGNQWRGYYDPYYNYYGYNSFYDPFWNGGLGMYYGSYFNNPFNNWGFGGLYGGWNFNPYWGVYSNFNRFGGGYYGGWGGLGGWGGYGGGFYAGGYNANYRPRPDRGGENGYRGTGRPNYGTGSNGVPSRGNTYSPNNGTVGRTRAESYNPATNGGTTTRPTSSGDYGRPTRTESSRPTRNDAPSRPAPSYNPPPQQSSPPPSSGGRSSGESSSGSGSSGGGRPGRG